MDCEKSMVVDVEKDGRIVPALVGCRGDVEWKVFSGGQKMHLCEAHMKEELHFNPSAKCTRVMGYECEDKRVVSRHYSIREITNNMRHHYKNKSKKTQEVMSRMRDLGVELSGLNWAQTRERIMQQDDVKLEEMLGVFSMNT